MANEVTLKDKTGELVDKLIEEDDIEKSKEYLDIFGVYNAKRNVARINKLNDLQDKINEQASKRLELRPDEMSDKDLISYMNAVQSQIEKSNQFVKQIVEQPTIQINQQNVSVNVENSATPELSKESRDRILKFIQEVQKQNEEIIEVDVEKVDDSTK